MKRITCLLICLALALTLFAACGADKTPGVNNPVDISPGRAGEGNEPDISPLAASSYADVYRAIEGVLTKYSYINGATSGGAMPAAGEVLIEEAESGVSDTMVAATAAPEAPAAAPGGDTSGSDYSETNVQVEGIDEADIVKTDGKYIYMLRDNSLYILEANGKDTKLLSKTTVAEGYVYDENGEKNDYAMEMYIAAGTLILVCNRYEWQYSKDSGIMPYYDGGNSNTARLLYYDVSDPASPRLIKDMGQDGSYDSSRMTNGIIYLLSYHYIYNGEPDSDTPRSFVPALYEGGEQALVPAECIILPIEINSTSYLVVSAYDAVSGERLSTQSVLGGGGTIYMSHDNLYVARSSYKETRSEPYKEDGYSVVACESKSTTEIMRFSLSGGTVTHSGTGTVDGNLINQFAMDEYEGNLRVVVTGYNSAWREYTDEKRGWVNYDWQSDEMTNALYVLGGDMAIRGSVTGLAKDERVYSVRFAGEIGYFVTFRQTDPLFAVDLKNPDAPKVLSALKIPGFSQYLHGYSEGRLFGLGMDADEQTGRTEGMKLSMFDISDPADVTEKHTLKLATSYSEALYNHKAILISSARDIIAFPADNGYDVYGYDDISGFYQKAHIDMGGENYWGWYQSRGLYIGDYAYICANGVMVFDMTDFSIAATVELPV